MNRKGSSPPGVGASQASDPWPAPQVGPDHRAGETAPPPSLSLGAGLYQVPLRRREGAPGRPNCRSAWFLTLEIVPAG